MQLFFKYEFLKKPLLVLFFLVLCFSFISAKAFAIDYWSKDYSSYNPSVDVIKTSDSKFMVLGQKYISSYYHAVLLKLNQDGSVDTSFGTNGTAVLNDAGTGYNMVPTSMMQDNSGSYLVAGYVYGTSSLKASMFVVKVTSAGAIDTTFANNGMFTYKTTSAGDFSAKAYKILKSWDGKYLVSGSINNQNMATLYSKYNEEGIIFKLTTAGVLDTSFGVSGSGVSVMAGAGGDQVIKDIAEDSSHRIYLCGVSNPNAFVMRTTSSGVLDSSYNSPNGGMFFYTTGSNTNLKCTIDNNGKLLLAAAFYETSTKDYSYLIRFNTTGSVDNTFGTSGVVRIAPLLSDKAIDFTSLAVDSAYRIMVAGYTNMDSTLDQSFAIRFTSSGLLDTNFGGNGVIEFANNNNNISTILPVSEGGYVITSGSRILRTSYAGDISTGCSTFLTDGTKGLSGGMNYINNGATFYNFGSIEYRSPKIVTLATTITNYCSYSSPTPTPTRTPTPTPTITVTPLVSPTGAPLPPANIIIEDETFTTPVTNIQGIITLGLADINTGKPIALVDIDTSLVSGDLIWSDLSGASSDTKSVLHYPGGIAGLPGLSDAAFILFVPKGDGTSVLICPGATTLGQVIIGCQNGYYLDEYAPNVSIVDINGITYWKVTGLTGTGGMSVIMGIKDIMTRLQIDQYSDHLISFGTNYGISSGQNFVIQFDPNNKSFDLTGLTYSDIVLTDSGSNNRTLAGTAGAGVWGVSIDTVNDKITFTAPTNGVGIYDVAKAIIITIGGTNKIKNPSAVSSVQEVFTINNSIGEQGTVSIPIVDYDTVDITGYVTAYMHFDIDTNTDNTDCGFNICKIHGGVGAASGDNYTVDLGELTSAVVNKSLTSSKHSDGINGLINSIFFDMTTNAPSGAVVTVLSANGGLQGPGTNLIPSIGVSVGADGIVRADGQDIPANSGVYGYNLPVASTALHGSVVANPLCDSSIKYCGASNLTPKTVFTTNSLPIDTARVRMDLAAAANYTNNPGVYTDTLTFVATSTF